MVGFAETPISSNMPRDDLSLLPVAPIENLAYFCNGSLTFCPGAEDFRHRIKRLMGIDDVHLSGFWGVCIETAIRDCCRQHFRFLP
jgi:hypothetical protein